MPMMAEQGISKHEAALQLSDAWKKMNCKLKLWEKELEQQQKMIDDAAQWAETQRQQEADEVQKELECKKREAERKKPKLPDFEVDMSPPDFLCERAAQYEEAGQLQVHQALVFYT